MLASGTRGLWLVAQARLVNSARALWSEWARRWYVYVALGLIWSLACTRLLIDPTPHVPLLFNWTPSLPYTVGWLERGRFDYKRGEFVLFSFAGSAVVDYPGLKGQPFFKVVRGVPGDHVSVHGREVYVNGELVGVAKTHTIDGRRLEPIGEMVIPAGQFYVQGTDVNSFDSRYRSSGLVRREQIIGRVTPLL